MGSSCSRFRESQPKGGCPNRRPQVRSSFPVANCGTQATTARELVIGAGPLGPRRPGARVGRVVSACAMAKRSLPLLRGQGHVQVWVLGYAGFKAHILPNRLIGGATLYTVGIRTSRTQLQSAVGLVGIGIKLLGAFCSQPMGTMTRLWVF